MIRATATTTQWRRLLLACLLGLPLLAAVLLVHLPHGSTDLPIATVFEALLTSQPDVEHQIVRHLYLPRAVMALLAGMSLGMAGVLLQTVTNNPLASPTTVGINSGAFLAAVAAAIFLPQLARTSPMMVSFAGGSAAAGLVYLVSGGVRVSPVRLVLAGVAVSMTLAAMTSALQVFYENETAGLFFWGSGTLIQRDWGNVRYLLPRIAAGGAAALLLARSLDVLRLGEDMARGLGQRVGLVRSLALLTGVFLAAMTVAVTGPIGFVGLVAPHLAHLLGARRHLLLLPVSAVLGGGLLLGADTLTRTAYSTTGELPTGVVTALIGAPCLVWLARRASSGGSERVGEDRPAGSPRQLSRRALTALFAGAAAVLLAAISIGIAVGDVRLEVAQVLSAMQGEASPFVSRVVLELRLPRVMVAALAGVALAVSGALFQGVIRNPLAAPETLGVTGGAGVGALLLLLSFPAAPASLVPLGAFAGAVAAFAVTYSVARRGGADPARLALIGIAVAAFCASVISVLVVKADVRLAQALVWLAGSTYAKSTSDLAPLAVALLVLLPLTALCARPLDLMALGDDGARGVGLALSRARLWVLVLATALAAAGVATVGSVGFLGLIAPHAARLIVGSRHRLLIPLTALLGATLLTFADVIGRTILAPSEVPAGLVTAVVGTPYFLWLLLRAR